MGERVKNDGIANNNRVAARALARSFARGFGHGTTAAAAGGEAKERESEGEEG